MKKYISIIIFFLTFVINAQEKSIFYIARSGSLDEMKLAYKTKPESIDQTNENGSSTLILASYRGNIEVAKFLIANVKDLNYNSGMGTALMGAVYKNQLELVKLLLENKANPNLVDANGVSALILAVQFKNYSIVNELIKWKADTEFKDKNGNTALEYAILQNDDKLIQILKTK